MNTKSWTSKQIEQLKALAKEGKTTKQIAELLDRSRDSVNSKASRLGIPISVPATGSDTPKLKLTHPDVAAKLLPPAFGRLDLGLVNSGDWTTLGLVGDTHLASKEERLAELHQQYDLYAAEGITTVFHAGNIVDGYVPRINGGSVFECSVDGQCKYVIDNYPRRGGITTYFITGDDHEGWWQKEGFNFGGYLVFLAGLEGRTDLKYIGHVEADVEIQVPGAARSTIIKIQHPGGGSAYARSYAGQKQVESLEGGEKPDILVQGHYHVSNYMNERNVHVINLPGFQDQTMFARKKRLRMEVGGAILSFKVNPADGSVTRCRVEINRYFTRGYYKKYLRSDAQVVKGHLVLTP